MQLLYCFAIFLALGWGILYQVGDEYSLLHLDHTQLVFTPSSDALSIVLFLNLSALNYHHYFFHALSFNFLAVVSKTAYLAYLLKSWFYSFPLSIQDESAQDPETHLPPSHPGKKHAHKSLKSLFLINFSHYQNLSFHQTQNFTFQLSYFYCLQAFAMNEKLI